MAYNNYSSPDWVLFRGFSYEFPLIFPPCNNIRLWIGIIFVEIPPVNRSDSHIYCWWRLLSSFLPSSTLYHPSPPPAVHDGTLLAHKH